jgi:hypothetical protein
MTRRHGVATVSLTLGRPGYTVNKMPLRQKIGPLRAKSLSLRSFEPDRFCEVGRRLF